MVKEYIYHTLTGVGIILLVDIWTPSCYNKGTKGD